MDLFEAISRRYSYRGDFTDAPVPRNDLETIVQAGIQAPSANNEQVAAFVIVDDRRLLRQIAEILDKNRLHSAAHRRANRAGTTEGEVPVRPAGMV